MRADSLRPWVYGLALAPLVVLSVLSGPYASPPIFADVDWYASVVPALTSDAPLYDPAYLAPHPLQRPVFWDQAPSAALFATLLLLPAGEWLWGILMAACVVAGLAVLWPRMSPTGNVMLACVLVAWMPITGALARGNLNALVFLCLAVAIRYPKAAGSAVGVATAAKLVPGLLIFWLLGKRDWRGAAVAVAIPLIATAVVVTWKGPDTLADFVTLRLNQWTPDDGSLYRWSPTHLFGLAATVGYAAALLLGLVALWRASFSIAVIAMLVSIPVMHVHYWSWVLVPFVAIWMPWFLMQTRREPAGGQRSFLRP